MANYKIIGRTNSWIANRNAEFNGNTQITLEKSLTLKEAQEYLLNLFNDKFETNYSNWGLCVIHTQKKIDSANTTRADGTRSFEWDSRYYSIEIE
jgi:hypothetical protein